MDSLDKEKFKQYFHYGLIYNQEDILDAIIINTSKSVNKRKFEGNKDTNALEFTLDKIENLYIQFERFINLADSQNKNWYKKVDKDTVKDTIMKRIEYLQKSNLISYVEYEPMYGIYITDRNPKNYPLKMNGEQRFENIPNWIIDDIYPILDYLAKLEKENPYQYNSLFLDTKYARSISDINISAAQKVEKMYSIFLTTVKPSKEDLYAFLGEKISREGKSYIEKNFPDYWTITDLKDKTKNQKYFQKLQKQCKYIKNQNVKNDMQI